MEGSGGLERGMEGRGLWKSLGCGGLWSGVGLCRGWKGVVGASVEGCVSVLWRVLGTLYSPEARKKGI